MRKVSNRLDKIGDAIRQELARLLQTELRDPRVGMASVTGVEVSRDLAHADIYVTILGAEPKVALDVLNKAGGFLRTLLAKKPAAARYAQTQVPLRRFGGEWAASFSAD